MISFELAGSEVKVKCDTGVGHTLITTFNCNSELYAKLLCNQLRDQYYKTIEAFAKKNYDEGYDDKKKRKPKRDWHPSTIK